MAKAKILADRISITSEILTDENIEKVSILAPRMLTCNAVETGEVLYEVAKSDCNTFSKYGACFKDGKSIGSISEEILNSENAETKIKNILTAILTKVNVIEEQVEAYLEEADDLSDDIEFLN